MIQVSEARTLGNAELKIPDMDLSPGVLKVTFLYSDPVLEKLFSVLSHTWDLLYHHTTNLVNRFLAYPFSCVFLKLQTWSPDGVGYDTVFLTEIGQFIPNLSLSFHSLLTFPLTVVGCPVVQWLSDLSGHQNHFLGSTYRTSDSLGLGRRQVFVS